MADRAGALLALWNDVEPALDAEYNDWHGHEHVPQRLTVPGILWGWRCVRMTAAPTMPRYLTLYGLRDPTVLESEAYDHLLREPTPWSRRMRPALANLTRWVCMSRGNVNLDAIDQIAVVTLSEAQAGGAGGIENWLATTSLRCLLRAERQPTARPLPWLVPGQAQGIDGQWLLCLAVDGDRDVDRAASIGATNYAILSPD